MFEVDLPGCARRLLGAVATFSIPCELFASGYATLPLKPIPQVHSIDQRSGTDDVFNTPVQQVQNRVKKDFCNSGDALIVALDWFIDRQSRGDATNIDFCTSDALPEGHERAAVVRSTLLGPQRRGPGKNASRVCGHDGNRRLMKFAHCRSDGRRRTQNLILCAKVWEIAMSRLPCIRQGMATILLCSILLALPTESNARSDVEYCSAYGYVAPMPFDLTTPFLPYSLVIEETAGTENIRIVADDLEITRENLGQLVKYANSVDPTIKRLTIDSRRIRFREQLSFSDANIDFIAEDITFADGSMLTLLPSPNSLIRLVANTITVSPKGTRHFDIRERAQPGGKPDDFGDIATLLEIHAGTVYNGDQLIPNQQVISTLAKRFTLSPIFDFTSKVAAETGLAGANTWLTETKQRAEWPTYTMGVWRSAFVVAPFDPCLAGQLRSTLDRYLPLFAKVAPSSANLELNGISMDLLAGLDIDGNGPAWATNVPLSTLRAEIADYAGGPRLLAINTFIKMLEDAANGQQPDPKDLISDLQSKIQAVVLEYVDISSKLGATQTSLDGQLASLDALKSAYASREQRLREYADELKRGAQDRAQIISMLSTAASLVTLAYTGDPNSAAAAGGVVQAVGQVVQGGNVWTSLSTGYKFYQEVKGPLTSMNDAVRSLRQSRDTYSQFIQSFTASNITIRDSITVPVQNPQPGQPTTRTITRDAALADLQSEGAKLKDGLDGVNKAYSDFRETPSDTPQALEDDESLKSYGEQIASALDGVKRLTLTIEQLQRTSQEKQVQLTNMSEQVAKLQNVKISNEQQRRELAQIALEGARDELAKFTSLTDLLRRSSVVEFRAPLPISPSHLQSVLIMQRVADGWDPTQVLKYRDSTLQYVEMLKARRDYVSILAQRIADAAERQFYEYVENRGRTPLVNLPVVEIAGRWDSPEPYKKFLGNLNNTLTEQFVARKDPRRLALLYGRRLEIPFDIKRKIDARFPARLLKAAILDVQVSGKLGGSDLIFTVDVERVGNLRQSLDIAAPDDDGPPSVPACISQSNPITAVAPCFSVDLRPKTVSLENYFVPYEYTLGQIRSGLGYVPTSQQSYWYISPGDTQPSSGRTMAVTYGPAEARMYLRVRMNTTTPTHFWDSAPQVRKIVIGAEIFQ